MAYKFQVPISTTQGAPPMASGSFQIRAPLTVDDDSSDFESSSSVSDEFVDNSVGSGSSDREFASGGEDFETASERGLVDDPDDGKSEINGFVGKDGVFRPFVVYHDEESLDGSVSDEYKSVVENEGFDRPIAQLSMDDDKDSDGLFDDEGIVGEVEEDGLFSDVVKAGNFEDLVRVDNEPEVGVLDLVHDELSRVDRPELQFGGENGFLGYKDDAVMVKGSADGLASVDMFKAAHEPRKEDELLASIGMSGDQDNIAVQKNGLELLTAESIAVETGMSLQVEDLEPEVVQLSDVDVDGDVDGVNDSGNDVVTEVKPTVDVRAIELNEDEALRAVESDATRAVTGSDELLEVDENNVTEVDESQIANSLRNDNLSETSKHDMVEDEWQSKTTSFSSSEARSKYDLVDTSQANNSLITDEEIESLLFRSSGATEHVGDKLELNSIASTHLESGDSHDQTPTMRDLLIADADEEVLLDSAALATLLKTKTGAKSDGSSSTLISGNDSRIFPFEGSADSGSSYPFESSSPSDMIDDAAQTDLTDDMKEMIEKIQSIRVKFLRLVQRLGHSFEDSVVVQILHGLAMGHRGHVREKFSLESAKRLAVQLEAEGKEHLDFSINILVLGKTGVGKSATINSIFGDKKVTSSAFEPATTKVKEIVGMVDGVNVRVLDTPGLRVSLKEEATNQRILASARKVMKKFPPDVVLYVDRLDGHTRNHNDLPLLKLLTRYLGKSIWKNAIVTLTHAGSSPPDGPFGAPLSFEVFVAQQTHILQQAISLAVGDPLLLHPSMMHPVALVENNPSCKKNEIGEYVLSNGQNWRSQLLLLCYSLKILLEANSISGADRPFNNKKLFGFGRRIIPLSHMVSSLLHSHPHPKLTADQGGDDIPSDVELESDSDEEDEYDHLPPFKPLQKSQIDKLSKEQRKAYFDEYDYRVKLLQKKQWRQKLKSLKQAKKGKTSSDSHSHLEEDAEEQNGEQASVPVALPDMILPPSFDSDNPSYRYRFLEPTSQLHVRPVLDSHGWDHDCGYDGLNLERNFAIANQFPGAFVLQVMKDKKEFTIHLDSSLCAKHGEDGSTMAGLDIQPIGRQLAYILRSETKFRNFRINKTAAGISITALGESIATGLKLEDQLSLNKNLGLFGNAGVVTSGGDAAYGANIELRMKGKDFPIDQDQSTLGLSLMKWGGELGVAANLQTEFSISSSSKVAVHFGVNSKRSGQISVKTRSSELQIGIIGFLVTVASMLRSYNKSI